jgi:Holliday junction resolvase RusA-like endonuclease
MRYIFNIDPVAKPRMVRSDTWNKRPAVQKYWEFKDELNRQVKKMEYVIGEELTIEFYIRMPTSWSKKKRVEHDGKPHKSKPDLSNLIKAWEDCLTDNDSAIHSITASKLWNDRGMIQVFTEKVKNG